MVRKNIRKDRNRRKVVEQGWKERRGRKILAMDERKPREERNRAKKALELTAGNRDQSRTRVRNRCVDTGNPRFVIRWFRRSGLRVRERALSGKLPGVYKISW
jgi:small subunit ribosomal protein S14